MNVWTYSLKYVVEYDFIYYYRFLDSDFWFFRLRMNYLKKKILILFNAYRVFYAEIKFET